MEDQASQDWKWLLSGIAKSKIARIVAILGFVLLILLSWDPNYDATYINSDSTNHLEITVRVKNSSPIGLAEYYRTLIVKYENKTIKKEIEQDSGGYTEANLFKLRNGDYLLKGPFDTYQILLKPFKVIQTEENVPVDATFLGVFDFENRGPTRDWKFMDSSQRSYVPREPRIGGR